MNQLYFGDNLDVLKQLSADHPDGFIDLIYIDPPFNSKRNYNILFEDADLEDAKAQKEAFADTWSQISYFDTLNEIQEIDLNLYHVLNILDKTSLPKAAISYLCTMAIRLWYMHKVLKETGSLYVHCDPTMSHYLKIVLDMVFGGKNFRNEIVWQRTNAHNMKTKGFVRVNDIILFYSKSDNFIFNEQYTDYGEQQLKRFKQDENGRYYKAENLTFSTANPGLQFEWRGSKPPPHRSWGASLEQLEEWYNEGRILLKKDGAPRLDGLKVYLDEIKGKPVTTNWTDIERVRNTSSERLGYPTQKPEALLERIIKASSNAGDLVADFCCGCGTTIAVAQKLKRRWLGVDISHLSIKLVMKRLQETYDTKYAEIRKTFEVFGIPKDIASARALAESDDQGRFKFQDWVIEFMLSGVSNPKKTADGGWDGHLTFAMGRKKEVVLIEVKSGNVNVKNLREFIHVVHAQQAAIGVFVCFQEHVTTPMVQEAKQQGYYTPKIDQIGEYKTQFPKIQILTVEQILNEEQVKIPMTTQGVFKTAGKHVQASTQESFL